MDDRRVQLIVGSFHRKYDRSRMLLSDTVKEGLVAREILDMMLSQANDQQPISTYNELYRECLRVLGLV